MIKRLAKIIRIITVAPLMALFMLVTLYLQDPMLFGRPVNFVLAVLFLVVFPLLAYPLQPLIKKYKDKGRKGQRTLALIFAVAGYIFGCLITIFIQAPKNIWIIYLCYLLSGIFVVLSNKLFHFKASGHACGVTGPFTLLLYFGQSCGFFGIPILALTWLSSLYMKRHTNLQLIVGAVIPSISLVIVLMIISIV